jgi:hypothetical protein
MRASLPNWREWVRVPSLAFERAVVAQGMQQPSRKRQDVGSIPTGGFQILGDRLTGRTAGPDPVDRGSNPRLPVGFFRSVAQRQQRPPYKRDVVGSIPTAPISSFWGCSQIGKALVLQTRNCGFDSHQLHFQDVGQWSPTCLGSKLTQVRILPS